MAEEVDPDELSELVARVPAGWTRHIIAGSPWGVTRAERAGGRTTTLTAQRLGGTGYLSANIWHTSAGALLRPCEMPAAAVLAFLRQLPREPVSSQPS
ncbi:MAG: peptide methionine sulfoxide reductase [Actinomycetota bacterium]|nr:peptide methionine sulfoxide reductase [Actinomycetota bacterium]